MLVKDFKEHKGYMFSEDTLLLIPNQCSTCGNELNISPTLTGLSCVNPRCRDKITIRTVSMFDMLNVTDIGEPTIEKLLTVFDVDNPLMFFMYEPSDWYDIDEDDYNESLKRKADAMFDKINTRREMTLVDFIKYANLPSLQSNADKLFEGIGTLEEFYDELDDYEDDFIQEKLGIQTETSVLSLKLYKTFIEFKEDLFEVYNSEFVTIIDDNKADIKIKAVCSDEVGGGFKRKADFYSFVEENFSDKVHVDWGKSATLKMDVLIWAGADGSPARYTNKVQKTENWNDQGHDIPILTAQEFIEVLDKSSDGQSVLDTLESM